MDLPLLRGSERGANERSYQFPASNGQMASGHSGERDALPKTSSAVARTKTVVDNLDMLNPMLERRSS